MAFIKSSDNIITLPQKEQIRYIDLFLKSVKRVVNGNIELNENVLLRPLEINFDTADTEKEIAHELKRIPRGYLVISQEVSTNVYDGDTAWNRDFIYLKSSAAGKVKVVIL